jgi:amidophosphoribosyltransferase
MRGFPKLRRTLPRRIGIMQAGLRLGPGSSHQNYNPLQTAMSDTIKHECGIAFIRLRKPLSYFIEKYGTPAYAVNKLYLLMEKQHNRGQDGVGVASVKIDLTPGKQYITRYRTIEPEPIKYLFAKIGRKIEKAKEENPQKYYEERWAKSNVPFIGEVYMGHLRYGTHGKNDVQSCHPMLRSSNWRSRNLLVAGNFNMTNVDELFDILVELGQHPKEKVDTVTVLEKIGHFLDEEVQMLFRSYKDEGLPNTSITERIEEEINFQRILQRACKDFDGGYAMMGLAGHGAAFIARDPAGIRPAYYYADDEIVVAASEKPAIKTAFGIDYQAIREIPPGHALIIDKKGDFKERMFIEPVKKKSCSFERIYFSRGSDPEIYQERKMLGELLCEPILQKIDYDLENTVFSYIPNTAETAFLGMMHGMENYLIKERQRVIEKGKVQGKELEHLLAFRPRVEKLVTKDVKMRTFITDDKHRDEMVAHVYDTTYEVVRKHKDTLVVIDDSVVRGTTLEKSILTMLDQLEPKRIVVVSSAPQIRYPDCYGIDMSKMNDFIAFRALLQLLEERGQKDLLREVYKKCKKAAKHGTLREKNHVRELYKQFKPEEISDKIAEIIRGNKVRAKVDVVFQSIEGLHKACPNHVGDWYFTGKYPTPGGNQVVNRAFMNFMDGHGDRRAY